ncbi:type II secretion system F family protein [Microbacterium karelineae]|uniref:type II secretion system F family protein n=1 Tax=Microbacterium karelineae TaxID=2654283 RepID=UPI0012E9F74B|nr:type II secretion system F family protein [Microbacterium karelineae]
MGMIARRADARPEPSATLLSLAVLLHAGASPAASWRHLAENGDPVAQRIVQRFDDGSALVAAIAAEGAGGDASWGDVAAAWEAAETVGAPLAETLRAVASSLRDASELRDDVRVALAEPMASARLMMWLPLLGVVVGVGLGLDPLGVLFGTTLGLVCLTAGLALIVLARWWTRRLVRAAQPAPGTPGMHEELLAVALSGGVSVARARDVLAGCDEWSGAATRSGEEADRVLALSRAAGVPAIELLRASAAHARHRARIDGRLRGSRLGTRLLLPMGVCTLPAFLLLGVAPMLLSVLTATPIPTFAG